MRKFAIVLGCLLYVISPIDLVPDLILGLGQLDDLGAIALTIKALLKRAEGRSGEAEVEVVSVHSGSRPEKE